MMMMTIAADDYVELMIMVLFASKVRVIAKRVISTSRYEQCRITLVYRHHRHVMYMVYCCLQIVDYISANMDTFCRYDDPIRYFIDCVTLFFCSECCVHHDRAGLLGTSFSRFPPVDFSFLLFRGRAASTQPSSSSSVKNGSLSHTISNGLTSDKNGSVGNGNDHDHDSVDAVDESRIIFVYLKFFRRLLCMALHCMMSCCYLILQVSLWFDNAREGVRGNNRLVS